MSILNFTFSAARKLLASAPAPSPTGDEHTGRSSSYANQGTLESDPIVVLAAMLCALICALGLNSLLRCALRCSRRLGVGSSDEITIQLANTRLKKAAMKALPISVYTSASKLPPGLATDCSICLAEFGEGEKVRVLPKCNHSFHLECIDKWLASHSSCPMCRHCLNMPSRSKNSRGSAIVQDTETNCNAMAHVVIIEAADSTQAISQRSQTLERIPQEATEVTSSSPLPPPSVAENQSSCDAMDNVD